MATKLSIYNDALRAIGEIRLVTTTDDIEARYALDDSWTNAVPFLFTEGLWNFATVSANITDNAGLTPIPGYSYGFDKPASWVRTIQLASTALFADEVAYRDEGGKFYANYDSLYIRYISNTLAVDGSVTTWPTSFAKLVAAYLAKDCCERISGKSEKAEALAAAYKDALASAKNKDALDQAKMYLRPGSWITAMRGSARNNDRGPMSGF